MCELTIILLQVGACIVDKNNKIVSFGYNGFPTNISDDDPRVTWGRDSDQDINPNEEFNKYLFGECAI